MLDLARWAVERSVCSALRCTRFCLSWGAWCAELSLHAVDACLPPEDAVQLRPEPLAGGSERSRWSGVRAGFSLLRDAVFLAVRIVLSVLMASVLYVLPVWGTPLVARLHLLPGELGADVSAEVSVGRWAASHTPGFGVVDVDLHLRIPSNLYNLEAKKGTFRIDLEVGDFEVSRAMVLPEISPISLRIREFLLAVPVATGWWFDEQVVDIPLVSELLPEELISPADIAASTGFAFGAVPSPARVRLAPAIVARQAKVTFQLRPRGVIGRLLSRPWGFIPSCAATLFLLLFRRQQEEEEEEEQAPASTAAEGAVVRSGTGSPSRRQLLRASAGTPSLSLIEAQTLAKALSKVEGAVDTQFASALAAFEKEDRATHGGILMGEVAMARLPAVIGAAAGLGCQASFDESEMQRIVAATLRLPPIPGGLVTRDGMLRYRPWLATAAVALLCGGCAVLDYAEWLTKHHDECWEKPS